MRIRFLLGPAGSGKTSRCLEEIRDALVSSPEGPPLVLLAPKQATFQLERGLLGGTELAGYARLQILSFERLAQWVITEFRDAPPELLGEQGRTMVLRALIGQHQERLQLFRASARMPSFAGQLSRLLGEMQEHHVTPGLLRRLSERPNVPQSLQAKLQDIAHLYHAYLEWLEGHRVEDSYRQIDMGAEILARAFGSQRADAVQPSLHFAGLWLDGFATLTRQEMALVAALTRFCDQATLAFCLDREPPGEEPWLSPWIVVGKTFRHCHALFTAIPEADVSVQLLNRDPRKSRFAGNPILRHLERFWSEPKPYQGPSPCNPPIVSSGIALPGGSEQFAETSAPLPPPVQCEMRNSIQLSRCANREDEAVLAAREILRHVRSGGRFREAAVLVRDLELYHDTVRRTFRRYGIPFFLDRREPVAHHALADLTRFALRGVAFGWKHEDLFGALKSGLAGTEEPEIDRLENEALKRGWEGAIWRHALKIPGNPELESALNAFRSRLLPPFHRLTDQLIAGQQQPTGERLAEALQNLWRDLDVERQLESWKTSQTLRSPFLDASALSPIHTTVWDQMNELLENLKRAFSNDAIPLREWLPILEAGLSSLTVGVIPPSIDQVLVGAVDRSRNPELRLAVLLGLNESVFPAPPAAGKVLTDSERERLESENLRISPSRRERLSHERYLGYIACSRASAKLILSHAAADSMNRPLNPSRFVSHLQRLFPQLEVETFAPEPEWDQIEHLSEIISPAFQLYAQAPASDTTSRLTKLPSFRRMLEELRHMTEPRMDESLSQRSIENLYGNTLRTSFSQIEKFAECPFRFFADSGLHIRERQEFRTDARKLGSFQHALLKRFHDRIRAENLRWRDLLPDDAKERIRQIGDDLARSFALGLFAATHRSRQLARRLSLELEDFVEATLNWLKDRNDFDPVAAELRFNSDGVLPAWKLPIDEDHSVLVAGSIDRVDFWIDPLDNRALCVVIDYKSSVKKINDRLLANGLQLQLPAYLCALRNLRGIAELFGVEEIIPVGVFYVNLRGNYERGGDRNEVLGDTTARTTAFEHSGRFDAAHLERLDRRAKTPQDGITRPQFSYRLTAKGTLHKGNKDPLPSLEFTNLLDQVEELLRRMARRVFNGEAGVEPYRHANDTPCERCDFQALCRIDPATHAFRLLAQ